MEKLLTLILLSLIIFSCSTKKVSTFKANTKEKIDSVYIEKKENALSIQSAINIKEDIYELIIIPVDSTKSIVIDNVEYKNASLKIRKSNKVITDSTLTLSSESIDKTLSLEKESDLKVFDKELEKKSNYFVYFWLLVLLILAFIVYKIRSRIFIR